MSLTELIVRQAKLPLDKPRKIFDGGGLYLLLTLAGKYWYFRYRYEGKDKAMPLGRYPQVSLKEARHLHMEARLKLAQGTNPNVQKNKLIDNSFEKITHEWYEHQKPSWKNPKHAQQVINTLSQYVFPFIGKMSIDDITPLNVFNILTTLRDKPETANRVKQRINAVFNFAIQTGRLTINPAQSAPKIVRSAKQKVKNHLSLPVDQIQSFFERLEEYPNSKVRLGLQFLILTFVRVGELRLGEWSEIQGNEWHIPAERMKMGRPHIVPLSDWALEILEKLKALNNSQSTLILTGNRNKAMSDSTFSCAMKRMGYQGIAVPHGFRAMASTVLNESGLFNPDAIERQLAHAGQNSVRAAYNRAEYLEERHEMMRWYSNFIKEQIKK